MVYEAAGDSGHCGSESRAIPGAGHPGHRLGTAQAELQKIQDFPCGPAERFPY